MKKYLIFAISIIILASCGKKEDKKAEEAMKADSLKKLPTTSNKVFGVARIEPEDGIINITAGTAGKITAVLVKENQDVKKGELLISIEVSVENAQLAQAQSKIATQKASIEANQANVEALKVNLKNARTNYERNLQLFNGNALTKQALDDSKATVDKLTKDIEVAEANVQQAYSRTNELKADVNYYQTVIRQKKVAAPASGRILSIPVKTGEYVNNTTQIAEFAANGALIAKTEVDELYAERVQVGQKAFIFSQATGDTLATGTVSFAADYLKAKSLFKDQSTEQEDRRVREVHIRLEEGKKPLISSRVDCLILLK